MIHQDNPDVTRIGRARCLAHRAAPFGSDTGLDAGDFALLSRRIAHSQPRSVEWAPGCHA